VDPKITIKRDRYSRLTYIVETSRGAPFLYRRISDIPVAVQAHVRREVETFLALRGLHLIAACTLIADEFHVKSYDWARAAVPKQYSHNASHVTSMFSVTCDMDSWYVFSPYSGKLRCIGRAKSKGANYRDKAYEVALRMSEEMAAFYRDLPTHERAA
jgi:hypothetical protein